MDEAKTNTSTATPDPHYGWTCPKCGKVWSPWTPSCDCSSVYNWVVTCNNSTPTYTVGSDYLTNTWTDARG